MYFRPKIQGLIALVIAQVLPVCFAPLRVKTAMQSDYRPSRQAVVPGWIQRLVSQGVLKQHRMLARHGSGSGRLIVECNIHHHLAGQLFQ